MTVGTTGGLPEPLGLRPGRLLLDDDWLSGQVRDTAAFYGGPGPKVSATLWWYSASAVLLGPSLHELVRLGRGASLAPADIRLSLRPAGLERVTPGPPLDEPGPAAYGAHLDIALAPVIAALVRVSGTTSQSLWAIAGDSLATRLLTELPTETSEADEAGFPSADPEAGTAEVRAEPFETAEVRAEPFEAEAEAEAGTAGPRTAAARIARGSRFLRPAPRYTQVLDRTYVHRVSCCLLYRVPMGKCLSCPRQTPAERGERLEQHARSST